MRRFGGELQQYDGLAATIDPMIQEWLDAVRNPELARRVTQRRGQADRISGALRI